MFYSIIPRPNSMAPTRPVPPTAAIGIAPALEAVTSGALEGCVLDVVNVIGVPVLSPLWALVLPVLVAVVAVIIVELTANGVVVAEELAQLLVDVMMVVTLETWLNFRVVIDVATPTLVLLEPLIEQLIEKKVEYWKMLLSESSCSLNP
jgi:hypothetical protein